MNLADGAFDFQAVEPLSTRYIEVFRGPNGLEHGAATLGGAINYVSPTGHDALPAEVRVEGGAFGYQRGQVEAGGVRGGFDYYGSLTHFGQDSFREHAVQSTQRFFGNLGLRHSPRRETRFWISAVRTNSELPGNLTKAQLEDDPRQAAAGNVALDQQRNFDLLRLSGRTTFLLSSTQRLDVSTFWSSKHLDHPIFQVLDQKSDDFGELLSLNDAVGNPLGTINADRTVHAGAEVGWELRLPLNGDTVRLRHVYIWSRFEFDGDPAFGDNRLAGMPPHFHRAELLWERPAGLYGGPSVEWVPERYPVDHANTLFADPYRIFGLKVGYRPAQGMAAFVEARNLTDEPYAATTGVIADARGRDSAQFLPGDGRSFFAGLEYRWGRGRP